MKKLLSTPIVLIAFFLFSTSIQQLSAQTVDDELELNNDVDSLSLLLGIAQTAGLKEYIVERLDVDTAYISDFIKGIYAGAQSGSDPSQKAFYAGAQIGQQITNQMVQGINQELFGDDESKSISLRHFLAGFVLGMNNNSDEEFLSEASEEVQLLMERIKEANVTPEQKAYKKKNEDWLATNKKKPGIHTLPSGVQYKVIKQGTGKKPTEDSEVVCHYEGRLIDGTEFDSSYKRNEPITFHPDQIIRGWAEALTKMPVGSIWEVYIPQELAYGSRAQGQIAPFSTLIFKIELISINE